ncbi:four helix bundle protein [Flavobacterium sp. xlx-214]|uniref:four helix bundle protein n=1 Tax=unclassified Flavobacterium TaxID=196869 RepID=UPI0013D5E047|nr:MULTISPECIES: four helix bundle protein [unclassified Flavobacterium]MBA5794016.1 four helix bundle protein [Flavobacterium sp. xlx-221]QMI83167.1 four helix bundle protein [Flavobacterium sp. xlx-214]
MQTHKDLEVWQRSMDLVTQVYLLTKDFPKEEIYGLTSQLRRCAISVPSNIAEGAARQSNKEFIQFLYISLGSLMELETQLIIAKNINFFSEISLNEHINAIEQIGKMLNGLIKYRKSKL